MASSAPLLAVEREQEEVHREVVLEKEREKVESRDQEGVVVERVPIVYRPNRTRVSSSASRVGGS